MRTPGRARAFPTWASRVLWPEKEVRTQGTFGAATPGRRVLYSASWVLVRLRRGGGAARRYRARRGMVNPGWGERVTERLGSRARDLRGEDLAPERYREKRSEPLDRVKHQRVQVVGGEVRVVAGLQEALLLLLER